MGSTLGLEKFREDWGYRFPVLGWPGFGLVLDGGAHALAGFVLALPFAVLGSTNWLCAGWAAAWGLVREGVQFGLDDDPHPNLLDRAKDVAEFALGGLIAGVVLC